MYVSLSIRPASRSPQGQADEPPQIALYIFATLPFQMHKLSEQQFIWAALIARARRKAWKDCEALTVTKGWLGGKKVKSVVEPEAVTKLLHQEGAPPDVLQVCTWKLYLNCSRHNVRALT